MNGLNKYYSYYESHALIKLSICLFLLDNGRHHEIIYRAVFKCSKNTDWFSFFHCDESFSLFSSIIGKHSGAKQIENKRNGLPKFSCGQCQAGYERHLVFVFPLSSQATTTECETICWGNYYDGCGVNNANSTPSSHSLAQMKFTLRVEFYYLSGEWKCDVNTMGRKVAHK